MPDERNLPTGRRFTRRSATFIGSFTFAARIVERLGAFGQIALIASLYGSSFLADRWFIASIGPLIVGAILGEALSANIMPALVRAGADAAPRLVAAAFWLATALLLAVTAAYVLVAAALVHAEAPTGSRDLGIWYAFAPIGPLLALSGFLSGVLTYYERYVWPPFRSAAASLGGFLLMLVAAAFTRDLVWVAAAVTGGYLFSFLALAVEIRLLVGRRTLARPGRSALRDAIALRGGLASPVLGGLLGGQVFVLLERVFASTIAVGAVSTLSYARGVAFTPVIAAQSVALGLYPGMVRAYEAGDLAHVSGSLLRGLRVTLFAGAAFGAFFALFGQQTIDVLLQRGALDVREAEHAGTALAAFSLALLGNMLMTFTARVFYAIDYFRAVVWAQACALAVYVVVALPLRTVWSTSGLAVAFGIAETTAAAYSVVLAGRRSGLSLRAALAQAAAPAVGRAAFVALALGLLRVVVEAGALGDSALVQLLAAIAVTAVACSAILWRAGWPELAPLKRGLRRLAF